MASAEKCPLHSKLFCKDCILAKNKLILQKEDLGKPKSGDPFSKKSQAKTSEKKGIAQLKIDFKVEELDETANFIVIYKKMGEFQDTPACSKNNFCTILSILEK